MKIQILDQTGKSIKEIETKIFSGKVREDIVQKISEVEKINSKKEMAPFFRSGMQASASGKVRHKRHSWKSDRGRGMSRVPKKRMARTGDRFTWVGAIIPGTVGGRRAHPPKLYSRIRKINKKELIFGLESALAMVANTELVKKKYDSLKNKEISIKLPIVIDKKVIELKTGEFIKSIKKILNSEDLEKIAIQEKKIRSGRGRLRNRKYKKNSGILLITGNNENKRVNGIEIIKAGSIWVGDLVSNGSRLVMFTEEGIKDLEKKLA